MHTFQVPKMSCGGCASAITCALKSVDDDAKIDIDISTKTVTVNSSASTAELAQAMTKAGYPPVE